MGGQDAAFDKAVHQNLTMADAMYDTAIGARKAGMDYATGAYKMGGFDQSAKYSSMQAGAIDAANRRGPGDFLNPQGAGGANAAMRAEAVSNVGAQKVMAGMDEMNKIRATLAGNGLQTTNFAQQEGEMAVKAAAGMDYNSTMSTVNMGLGLASTAYGAYKNSSGKTPPPSSQFGFGVQGSSMGNWQTQPITSLVSPGQMGFTGGK